MPGPGAIGTLGYASGGGVPAASPTTLGLAAARRLICARLVTYWAARGETAPLTFDNESYDGPRGPWVRLVVRHFGSIQMTLGPIGSRRFRRSGSILVQCFDVSDIGLEAADTLAASVTAIFEAVKFSTIETHASVPRELPSDGMYAGIIVEIPFDYDEIK